MTIEFANFSTDGQFISVAIRRTFQALSFPATSQVKVGPVEAGPGTLLLVRCKWEV
jgi:hypothetical protein